MFQHLAELPHPSLVIIVILLGALVDGARSHPERLQTTDSGTSPSPARVGAR